ncbi:MAG: response regulator [Alphaproteobacteria bacterium]|nr:response regulator [Alphaproteobacteria bacterium]MBV8549178.1 response regulator [Alphaproteobacteria bacterium]
MAADCLRNKNRPVVVLLIEDNNGDALLLRKAMKDLKGPYNVVHAKTAEAALSMLRGQAQDEMVPTPDMIILDLNLPQMHGLDFLSVLKEDSDLKHIPVVVLSSSRAEQDVMQSYKLHANGYIAKPNSLSMFKDVARAVDSFFVDLVLLPDDESVKWT